MVCEQSPSCYFLIFCPQTTRSDLEMSLVQPGGLSYFHGWIGVWTISLKAIIKLDGGTHVQKMAAAYFSSQSLWNLGIEQKENIIVPVCESFSFFFVHEKSTVSDYFRKGHLPVVLRPFFFEPSRANHVKEVPKKLWHKGFVWTKIASFGRLRGTKKCPMSIISAKGMHFFSLEALGSGRWCKIKWTILKSQVSNENYIKKFLPNFVNYSHDNFWKCNYLTIFCAKGCIIFVSHSRLT